MLTKYEIETILYPSLRSFFTSSYEFVYFFVAITSFHRGDSRPAKSLYHRKEEKKLRKIQISLAAARVNAGLSQNDVVRELHVSKQTIVNWENGKSEPTISQARALSDLYKMPLEFIFLPEKSN